MIPWNSETSRSSQLAFGYNSAIELRRKALKRGDESTQNKKKRSWNVKLWKLYTTIVLFDKTGVVVSVELLKGSS